MLSKSMAISLPFVLIALQFYMEGTLNIKSCIRKLWPFLLATAAFIPVTIMSQDINREGISLLRQSYVLFHNMAWYGRTTFLPSELSPIYPRVIFSGLEIIRITSWYLIFLFIAYFFFRIDRVFFKFKILPMLICFLLSLGPVAGFLPLGAIDYADRYSYIPSVFIWIVIGLLLTKNRISEKIPGGSQKTNIRHRIFIAAVFFYISCIGIITLVYSNMWRDYYSVLTAATLHEPPSYIALGALGDIELSRSNYPEAIKLADRIINREKGLETQKGYDRIILKAKYSKAIALYGLGDKKSAIAIFEAVKPYMGLDCFGTADGYRNMVKVMIDCYNSIGEKEKADKLNAELIR
jgi:hypothetical protein